MSVVPIGRKRWPSRRGNRAAFARRFGPAWTGTLQHALTRGDPLADALVAIDGVRGVEVRRQLARGFVDGLASLDEPDEAVAALLADTERVPPHVDAALVASGPPGWYTVPLPLHLVSMSAGALVGLYAASSIARVLSSTGCLMNGAEHRLRDTARWLSTSMLPGSLAPGREGYVATLQVRLLHAHMRQATRRRGHDEAAFGVPVCQADLAFTWLGFTLASMRAEAAAGFDLDEAEIAGTYRYWRQTAHLLGLDADLVGDIESHDDAEQLEERLWMTMGETPDASALLAARTLDVVGAELERLTPLPGGAGDVVLRALIRRFHGAERAEALDAGGGRALERLLGPLATAARAHRFVSRRDAARWEATCTSRVDEALAREVAARSDAPNAYERLVATLDASVAAGAPAAPHTCGADELPKAA